MRRSTVLFLFPWDTEQCYLPALLSRSSQDNLMKQIEHIQIAFDDAVRMFSASPMHWDLPTPEIEGLDRVAIAEVDQLFSRLETLSKERLDWKRTIVDVLKLLNLNSGIAFRQQLAKELSFAGDTDNVAEMNDWLHDRVISLLASRKTA